MLAWAWFTMMRSESKSTRDLRKNSTALDSGPLHAAIQQFRATMGVRNIQVFVYDQPVINGLAAPDGRIYLTRGLIERYRAGEFTLEELAAIVAHEVGHVALGHIDRRKKAWQAEMAVKAAAQMFVPRMLGGIIGTVTNFISRMLHMGLSRNDEYEADAFAVALLQRTGFDPHAKISLLNKLDRLGKSRGASISWLDSHPPTAKRIAAVERAIDGGS